MKDQKTKSVLNYLFFCIVINMIPPILLAETNISGGMYTVVNAAIYVIELLIMLNAVKENFAKVKGKQVVLLSMLFLLQILTQIINIYKGYSLIFEDVVHILSVTINIFVFIICLPYTQITKEELETFMKKMVMLGFVACVYNVIKNISMITSLSSLTSSYSANISSFFPNRNQFGIFLLEMLISNLYVKASTDKKFYKFTEIFFIINLLLTMSRNSILGLIAIYVIKFYIEFFTTKRISKNKMIFTTLLLLAMIVAVCIIISTPKYMNVVEKLFIRSNTLETGSGRTTLWRNAIDLTLNNNWLIGVGRFNALRLNANLYNSDLEFHSVYIEVFATYGIIGIIAFILFISSIIKKTTNKYINKGIQNIPKITIIVFLVISIFETVTRFSIGYADMMGLIFFIALPLLISNMKVDETEEK